MLYPKCEKGSLSLPRNGFFLALKDVITLRAELLLSLFLNGQETEKEALHKSALTFEVAVAPTLGLVIPVYCRQTGFSSASINFNQKPMVETEPTEKHGGEITGRLYPLMCVWPGFETVS